MQEGILGLNKNRLCLRRIFFHSLPRVSREPLSCKASSILSCLNIKVRQISRLRRWKIHCLLALFTPLHFCLFACKSLACLGARVFPPQMTLARIRAKNLQSFLTRVAVLVRNWSLMEASKSTTRSSNSKKLKDGQMTFFFSPSLWEEKVEFK